MNNPQEVNDLHARDDVDRDATAHHHTLGKSNTQAAPGNHDHPHTHDVPYILGSGAPEGVVTAPVGKIFLRDDGSAGTTFYVKETGTGNTGWAAK